MRGELKLILTDHAQYMEIVTECDKLMETSGLAEGSPERERFDFLSKVMEIYEFEMLP